MVERWRSLLSCYSGIALALDRELHAEHGITMSDFEVLDRLAENSHPSGMEGCTEAGMRIQEIGEHIHLSQSALSRTVARLEKSGLVERVLCEFDRRGVFVALTKNGRACHTAAARTRLEVLREHLAG
ncbi:MarR family transcriptional regulator [Mangrovactinospora gilvigrisea]|uniref:MarR family transcriptional regulator n=1 Tax=Mangrovactinospora gilvigrisea TaxID=1428644 RepID=A0A1J7C4E7_9ACTN|nr:MarR family transcriptional regulator [Mangrovactinospora gilvigrisea]